MATLSMGQYPLAWDSTLGVSACLRVLKPLHEMITMDHLSQPVRPPPEMTPEGHPFSGKVKGQLPTHLRGSAVSTDKGIRARKGATPAIGLIPAPPRIFLGPQDSYVRFKKLKYLRRPKGARGGALEF